MITISRTLIKDDKSSIIIWDRGYEFWELEGDVLRHFRLLERRLIDQEGKKEQENKKDQGSLKDQSYPQILEVLEVLEVISLMLLVVVMVVQVKSSYHILGQV